MFVWCRFETALRHHCPTCCVPYVDTRLDCYLRRPIDSAMWTPWFLGNNQGRVTTGIAANWRSQPTDCDIFGNGVLTRFMEVDACWSELQYTDRMVRDVMNKQSYNQLCTPYDFNDYEAYHGGPHMWVSGHMASLPCAPLDPYFWMHHGFVDMLAEKLKELLPSQQWRYPVNWMVPWGHRATDPMRPFDYLNVDGLDDEAIGKNYFYEISPADDPCDTHAECSPTGLLWCDRSQGVGQCKATCREGGACTTGVHVMCYCMRGSPRCDASICRCV